MLILSVGFFIIHGFIFFDSRKLPEVSQACWYLLSSFETRNFLSNHIGPELSRLKISIFLSQK